MSTFTRHIELTEKKVIDRWQEVIDIKKEMQPKLDRHEKLEAELKTLTEEKQALDKELNEAVSSMGVISEELAPVLNDLYGDQLGEYEVIDSIEKKDEKLMLVVNDRVIAYQEQYKKRKAEQLAKKTEKKDDK